MSKHTDAASQAGKQPTDSTDSNYVKLGGLPDAPHHCPLCQFFGDAQWAEAFSPDKLVLEARTLVDLLSQARPVAVVGLHLARGPPASALS